jgi:hypothetical protein
VPPSLADNLTRLIAEGTGEEDEGADEELRAGAASAYLALLERPKLPRVLLRVICWVVGEYGRLAPVSAEAAMDRLAAIPETQAADDEVGGGWLTPSRCHQLRRAVHSAMLHPLCDCGKSVTSLTLGLCAVHTRPPLPSGPQLGRERTGQAGGAGGAPSDPGCGSVGGRRRRSGERRAAAAGAGGAGAAAGSDGHAARRAAVRRRRRGRGPGPGAALPGRLCAAGGRRLPGARAGTRSRWASRGRRGCCEAVAGCRKCVVMPRGRWPSAAKAPPAPPPTHTRVQAVANGAAPYLSLEDRQAMGMTRGDGGVGLHHVAHHPAALKYEAYAAAPPPQSRPAGPPAAAVGGGAAMAGTTGDLDLTALALSQPAAAAPPAAPAAAAAAGSHGGAATGTATGAAGSGEPQLILNKPGRKWGGPVGAAAEPVRAAATGATASQYGAASLHTSSAAASPAPGTAPPPPVDAEKQRLAASLFGGGGGSPSPGLRGRRTGASPAKPARPPAPALDLLGGMGGEPALAAAAPPSAAGSDLDLLMGLDAPPPGSGVGGGAQPGQVAAPPLDPMAALAGLGSMQAAAAPPAAGGLMGLGDLLGNGSVPGGMQQREQQPAGVRGWRPEHGLCRPRQGCLC